jgi:hypothetical protein
MDTDGLMTAVKILMNMPNVGGVTAKMVPVSDMHTTATRVEYAYRGTFDSMMIAESAFYSTFPGYTCFALLRKSSISAIPSDYGSSDGNISLSIIKNGFRYICAPNLAFYEPISQRLQEQRRQKTRRAGRLIQSIMMNRDILFNRKYSQFGTIIFPLRFTMFIICPSLILVGVSLMIGAVLLVSFPYFVLLLALGSVFLFLGTKTSVGILNAVASFLIQQVYLLLGFLRSLRRTNVWKPIERRPISR